MVSGGTSRASVVRRLLRYVKPYWGRFILASVCAGGVSLLTAANAWLVKPVLDEIFVQRNTAMLAILPFAIVAVAVAKRAFQFAHVYLMGYTGNRIITDIRDALYHHILKLSLTFHATHSTGALMSNVTSDVALMQRAVSGVIKDLIQQPLTLLALMGVTIYQNWRMAFIAIAVLPFGYYPMIRLGRRLKRLAHAGQERVSELSSILQETFSGIRVVKAFGTEAFEAERLRDTNLRYFRNTMKVTTVSELAPAVMEVLGAIGGAAVIAYGGYAVVSGQMTTGAFFSFLTASFLMYAPIRILSAANTAILSASAAAERVFAILDVETEEGRDRGRRELTGVREGIEFRDVGFTYDGAERVTLAGITLRVRAGEVVAVVGTSGSGKTTLVNLLPRFIEPTRGAIFIDGVDVRELRLASLRRHIGVVSQEVVLFDDSVRNNIAYGMTDIVQADVVRAAEAAYAHPFILQLPAGYDTVIGERGATLSGGERQRLAIARALLKDPPILILDEATSALDAESEAIVQRALANLIAHRTTFVIAHRLSTVQRASRIVVLDRGTIVEEGTHASLLARQGIYANLYRIQFEPEARYAGS
ncbi:MAG: ATP-binding cassette domain-containing protein [Nitrospirae bacterium]|nr:ATP-binding cassette domain-containing protein [Nitrospirota bacterium]